MYIKIADRLWQLRECHPTLTKKHVLEQIALLSLYRRQ